MHITYLAHSGFRIESGDHTLLVDPFLTGNPLAPCTAASITKCHYVLLTHGHDDHVGDAPDIARRTGATIIGNFEIACYFSDQGLKTHGMYHGGGFDFPFGRVKMVQAHHGSGYHPPGGGRAIYLGQPAGLVVALEGKNIYHAGDTVGSSRVDLQACKLEYSIVSPK